MRGPTAKTGESVTTDADSPLDAWVAAMVDRIGAGEALNLDELAREFPEGVERIRRVLPALALMAGRCGSSAEMTVESIQSDSPLMGIEAGGSLGDFRTIRELGRGGMGVVYDAIQVSLNRRVALKILPAISAGDPRKLRRFQVEAQAAACLHHPHIVPVYLVGSDGDFHFYAMQLIEGGTLAEWIAEARRHREQMSDANPSASHDCHSFRVRAELGRQAAQALHFAHEQGIVHRDVKPSNLLVDDSGWLWVADFGLARISGEGNATVTGAMMGTLRYTSPEQAVGSRADVDHRTDVYSLGASLYELITLAPVFEEEDRIDLLRKVVHDEPRPPRRIDPSIPADLETIVLKAMAKDRSERYSTAQDLADDLGRFLQDRPILARPPGIVERAAKWARRHKSAVAAATLLLFVAVTGLGGAAFWRADTLRRHNLELRATLDLARKHEASTLRLLYDSQVRLAQQALTSGQAGFAQEILEGLRPATDRTAHLGFEWRYLNLATRQKTSLLFDNEIDVNCLTISPDGRELCIGDREGTLVFWDLARGRERFRARAHSAHIGDLLYSPDGRILASQTGHTGLPGEIKLWDPATGRQLSAIPGIRDPIDRMIFSPDSRGLALLECREPAWEYGYWDLSRGPEHPQASSIRHGTIAFSADNRWLGTSQSDRPGLVNIRNPVDHKVLKSLPGCPSRIQSLAFADNGTSLAVGYEHEIAIWDVDSGREIGTFPLPGHHLAFSPDGNALVAAGNAPVATSSDRDRLALLVGIRGRPRRVELEGLSGWEFRSAFSPDSRTIAIAGAKLPPTLWDTFSGRKTASFPEKTGKVFDLAYTPNGQSLIFTGEDGRVRRWYFGPRRDPIAELAKNGKEIWTLAYSPDGSTLASAGDDHLIKLWNPHDGTLKATLKGHGALVSSVTFSPDGAKLASAGFDKTVRLWDLRKDESIAVLKGHTNHVRTVAFSPDGRKVASAGTDGTVRIWDAETERHLVTSPDLLETVHAMAFDPGGTILVTACNDRTIKGIDADTGAMRFSLASPRRNMALAFSSDGNILASTDDMGGVTFWNTSTWTKRNSIKGSEASVFGIAFSPDGRTLATACGDNLVRLWDPDSGQMLLELAGHQQRVNAVAFSPDGKTLASASHDGAIKLWQAGEP